MTDAHGKQLTRHTEGDRGGDIQKQTIRGPATRQIQNLAAREWSLRSCWGCLALCGVIQPPNLLYSVGQPVQSRSHRCCSSLLLILPGGLLLQLPQPCPVLELALPTRPPLLLSHLVSFLKQLPAFLALLAPSLQ